MPPMSAPTTGMTTSLTSELTIPENAPPMMIPTARSITFPLAINERNSETTDMLSLLSWRTPDEAGAYPPKRPQGPQRIGLYVKIDAISNGTVLPYCLLSCPGAEETCFLAG